MHAVRFLSQLRHLLIGRNKGFSTRTTLTPLLVRLNQVGRVVPVPFGSEGMQAERTTAGYPRGVCGYCRRASGVAAFDITTNSVAQNCQYFRDNQG